MASIGLATLAALVGAAIGWALVGLAAYTLMSMGGVRDVDGGLAMTAFFFLGPAGGLTGFFAAGIFALRRLSVTRTRVGLGRLAAVCAMAAALVGGGALALWQTRSLVSPNTLPPELLFEIRLPPGMPPLPLVSRSDALARRSPVELRTPENTMSAELTSQREESGRVIVVGRVELYYRTADRHLVLKHPPGAPEIAFRLPIGRTPAPTPDFGAWQGSKSGGQFELRYRVIQDGD